ncbi:hypothetical protein ACSW29_12570 [Rhodococcus sp. GB-02]
MTITTEPQADPFTAPATTPPKRYKVHGYTGTHPCYRTLARCAWPSAAWISGGGPYAVVARCRPGAHTITLHDDLDRARASLAAIDRSRCGGVCRGRHDLVAIVLG